MKDTAKPTVTAFVGRSFADVDRDTWYGIREILESYHPLGFRWEDAKEAMLSPISQKIRDGIERNQIYIGVMTNHFLG